MGTPLRIILDAEADAKDPRGLLYKVKWRTGGAVEAITALPEGMRSGNPSVGIVVKMDDGSGMVFAETSLGLFLSAADAFKARFGDPRKDDEGRGSS